MTIIYHQGVVHVAFTMEYSIKGLLSKQNEKTFVNYVLFGVEILYPTKSNILFIGRKL